MSKYVLENSRGQVVRTFQWEGDKMSLVYREDTKRVVSVSDVRELEDEKIPFLLLKDVSKKDLAKKPVTVGTIGTLKAVDEVGETSPTILLVPDSTEKYKKSFIYVGSIQMAVLLISFLATHFFATSEEIPVPPQTVHVVQRPNATVEPITHKENKHKIIQRQKVVAKVAPTKNLRKSTSHAKKRTMVAVNNVGEMGVLGALGHSTQKGGLNLNNIQTSKGVGLGGSQGSGGMQTSLYAKGLIAAPLGEGQKAQGAGGYGTKGKGGGQAGYGKMSMIGSSNAFFQPVEREATVEGGLDREQIADVIQRNLGQIRLCYEQGLQERPKLSGRVAVKFVIGGRGFVSVANVSNTSLREDHVEGCIVARLKTWKFPEPRGGVNVRVTYPFVLRRLSQS